MAQEEINNSFKRKPMKEKHLSDKVVTHMYSDVKCSVLESNGMQKKYRGNISNSSCSGRHTRLHIGMASFEIGHAKNGLTLKENKLKAMNGTCAL